MLGVGGRPRGERAWAEVPAMAYLGQDSKDLDTRGGTVSMSVILLDNAIRSVSRATRRLRLRLTRRNTVRPTRLAASRFPTVGELPVFSLPPGSTVTGFIKIEGTPNVGETAVWAGPGVAVGSRLRRRFQCTDRTSIQNTVSQR